MNSVGQLASGIWDDLGQPSTPTVTAISGWIGSDRALGKLNLLLGTQFIIDASGAYTGQLYEAGGYSGVYQPGDYYPAFGNTEAAVFAEVYKWDYYDKKIRDALNGILDPTNPELDWNSLGEGDTRIQRSNRNEVVKTYRGLQQDSRLELQKLVGYYRSNGSVPSQITTQEPSIVSRIYYTWGNYNIRRGW